MLATGATLLLRGFVTLIARVETGFDATHVLTAGLPMPATRYQSGDALNAHLDEIERRLRREPGVRDVAVADSLPTYGAPFLTRFQRIGQTAVPFMRRPVAGFKVVSPSYFRVVGLRLFDGRTLTDDDRAGTPLVVVINEAMARAHFPGTDPIGERLLMRRIPLESATSAAGPPRRASVVADSAWTIVGVIADEGVDPFDARVAAPAVYAAREQHPRANLALVVRTRDDPDRMREPIRKAVAAFDPEQALPDLKTIDELVAEDVAPDRLRSVLLSAFAAVALALAGTGLYGLIAYAVAQRRREIGIRIALGASTRNIRVLVVRELAPPIAAGLAAGIVGAAIVARALHTFLYGVSPADAAAFAAVAALLALVSVLACYVPTRRATRIRPLDALRS
jgi:predicted permease